MRRSFAWLIESYPRKAPNWQTNRDYRKIKAASTFILGCLLVFTYGLL